MSLVHEALEKAERERSCRQKGARHAQRKAEMQHSKESSATPSHEISLRLKTVEAPSVYSEHSKKSKLDQWLCSFRSKKTLVGATFAVIACVVFFLLWNGVEMNPSSFEGDAFDSNREDRLLNGSQNSSRRDLNASLASKNDEKAFRLSGIMADPEGTFCAVLNGFIVYPGEKIPGGTIRQITRDAVLLDTPGRSIELRLN